MKKFRSCPLCGNCQFFRKAVRDKDGKVIENKYAHCAVNATPIRKDLGYEDKKGHQVGQWLCEPYATKKKGNKKVRKNKPWQRKK